MASKTVAKSKTKKDDKVDKNIDPLADLGLTTEVAEQPASVVVAATEAPAEESSNDEVEVGDIEIGFADFIPTAKRKAGGSKYKFDQLAAPGVYPDGPNKGKPMYSVFTVKLQPGVDPDKLRRSVQSATTQANKQGEAEGKYFVSRSVSKDGKFIGMQVFRTDVRSKE